MEAGTLETNTVTTFMPSEEMLQKYAQLIVGFAANVQPGQIVHITSETGKEPLTRHIADAAYQAGAKYVGAVYGDPNISKASRIRYTQNEKDLEFVMSWPVEFIRELGTERAATIAFSGSSAMNLTDLDPRRLARLKSSGTKEHRDNISNRRNNWTGVPYPTEAWAAKVHPDLPPPIATKKLWEQVLHVCRLDEDDPIAAWRQRQDLLGAVADKLTARKFDALHFESSGPDGTDLTVGLLPSSTWVTAGNFWTADGIRHMPNLPSEETFTSPDPTRINGLVVATKPLELRGALVEDFAVTFQHGEVSNIRGSKGVEALQSTIMKDEGARRLGEVALVDAEGRVGPLNTIFFDTLLDENAASHLAFGAAYGFTVGEADQDKINNSQIHVDFMFGSPDMRVTGITQDDERVPVMMNCEWQI